MTTNMALQLPPITEFGRHPKNIDRAIRDHGLTAPRTKLPPVSRESMAFATTGEPSYVGITPETYLGADRGVSGTFTVTGDWQ